MYLDDLRRPLCVPCATSRVNRTRRYATLPVATVAGATSNRPVSQSDAIGLIGRRRWLLARAAGTVVACLGLAALTDAAVSAIGRQPGRIVDAQDGGPIEGAVVLVLSFRNSFVPSMEGPVPVFYKAVEVVSDGDGTFVADRSAGLACATLYGQKLIVFKPGYRPLVRTTRRELVAVDPVVGLTKIVSVEEARAPVSLDVRVCSGRDSSDCVPTDRIPTLRELLRIDRNIFTPYPLGHFEPE